MSNSTDLNRTSTISLVIIAVGICAIAFKLFVPSGNAAHGETRPATTKDLMQGIISPSISKLNDVLNKGMQEDGAWNQVTCHAACLNEMSYVLMDDGRCPNSVWQKAASETLRQSSEEVLSAAKKKDANTAKAAVEKMTESCAACHDAHRK